MDAARRPAFGGLRTGATAPRVNGPALGVAIAVLLLLAEAIYIPLASPRFAVRVVEIRGEERVARAIASSVHLPANTNMIRAPLGLVKRQAESCAAVREARVSRALPDRIVITAERREPIAVVRRSDAAILIDPDGAPFTVAGEWGWGLPELSAPRLLSGDLTSKAAAGEIRDLIAVLRALGPDPRLRVTRLQLGRDERIELALDSGAVVELGEPKDLGAKARLLVAAIERIGIERIKRLDLSVPRSAYWEPREGHQSAQVRE